MRIGTRAAAFCVGAVVVAACSTTKTTVTGPAASGRPAAAARPVNPLAKLPAAEVYRRSHVAAVAARSVHVTGSLVDESTKVSVNVRADRTAPGSGSGMLAFGGPPLQVIRQGGALYLRASADGWRSLAKLDKDTSADAETTARVLDNRWVKGSAANGDLSEMADLVAMPKLLDTMLPDAASVTDGLVNKGVTVDHGRQVVVLAEPGGDGRIEVAATGLPYPVLVDAGSLGSLHYDSWNLPVRVTPPPAGEVLDIPAG